MTSDKMRAKERGLLLGTTSLLIYLFLFLLPAKLFGASEMSYRLWLVAVALTLTVQGLLWWILRRGWRPLERFDPHFLHFPVLGASLLLNFYLYAAPDTRILGLLAWILVLIFGSARAGFAEVVAWSAVHLTAYLAVFFAVRERIPGLSWPQEIALLWMFVGVCVGIAILFERLQRWLEKAKAEHRRSEQAAAERRQLETQVQYLQRLESLGILAGGVAHDFNNILVSVLGYAELALEELDEETPARRRIQRVVTSAERAAELVDQLLAYSGQGQFVIETLDLSRILDGVGDLLSASISKKAALEVEATHGAVFIEADRTQLNQVLVNLVTNASDALRGRAGRIAVTTGLMRADRAYLAHAFCAEQLREGEYAFLEVADGGCGMDRQTRERMFDPFFSTKFVGRGLGMAAVLGIVRGHRGAIHVDSELDRGTTIRLLLPPAAPPERLRSPAARPRHEPVDLTEGIILIVDDDPAVREFALEALERSGSTVLTASDGAEGVEVFRHRWREITAVLLDVTMPVMNGAEAFHELRRIHPEARVVLMSGFTERLAMTDFGDRRPAGFLHKPFSPDELDAMLQEAVSGPAARREDRR